MDNGALKENESDNFKVFSSVAELENYLLGKDVIYMEKNREYKMRLTVNLLPSINKDNTCFYIRSHENVNISIFSILTSIKPVDANFNNFFFHNNNILYSVNDNLNTFPVIINRIVKNNYMMLHPMYNYIKFNIDKSVLNCIEKNSCEYQIYVIKEANNDFKLICDVQYINSNNNGAIANYTTNVIVNRDQVIKNERSSFALLESYSKDKTNDYIKNIFYLKDIENLKILFAFKVNSHTFFTRNQGKYTITSNGEEFKLQFQGLKGKNNVDNISIFAKKRDSLIWNNEPFSGSVIINNRSSGRDSFKIFKHTLFTICCCNDESYYILIIMSSNQLTCKSADTIGQLLDGKQYENVVILYFYLRRLKID